MGAQNARWWVSLRLECANQAHAMSDQRSSLHLMPTLLLAVTGCILLPAPVSPQRTSHVVRRPHRRASTTPAISPPAAVGLARTEELPAATTAPVPPDQTAPRLIGVLQPDVRRVLGPPTTSSTKGAAQAWTYQCADCSVDIGFYHDVTRNAFFALRACQEIAESGGAGRQRVDSLVTSRFRIVMR
jgi:hypothetical protein